MLVHWRKTWGFPPSVEVRWADPGVTTSPSFWLGVWKVIPENGLRVGKSKNLAIHMQLGCVIEWV